MADLKAACFDLGALWRRVGHDAGLLRELIELLEREWPEMLTQIRSAIRSNDGEKLRRTSHKIKGSALQFSAYGAVNCAAKLEQLGKSGSVVGADRLLDDLERELDLLLTSLHKIPELKIADKDKAER